MFSTMLRFEAVTPEDVGRIGALLTEGYQELLSMGDDFWLQERESWMQFDAEVFENLSTIGQCVFLTRLGTEIIGFSSFDPRPGPSFGILGHNCIRPPYRGQGFGKCQVYETLSRLRMRSIRKAIVSTGEHPFFVPAQKMYLSCGFHEMRRRSANSRMGFRVIEYELAVS
jgi:GNAT superfamily N-acetyltransferase